MSRSPGAPALACALLALGCAPPAQQGAASSPSAPEALARPTAPMPLDDARRYVLALVNRDRSEQHLPPVVWDETAAQAGQAHAVDMAARGFTAHLGSDGSVPEQRYTQAGGQGMVMENVGCFADAEARKLDGEPLFAAEELEKVQRAFMDEAPPMDGHRRNVLMPWHTSLGVGLSKAEGLGVPCMAQEFVDDYGRYDELKAPARPGARVTVAGKLRSPAKLGGVGVSRVDRRGPLTAAALNQTHGYAIPQPFATYFPKGYKTPIVVQTEGDTFRIELPLNDQGKKGLYGVSVWAILPGSGDLRMVSLRTIDVK